MMEYIAPALVLGFLMDLLVGDPRWLYHPVCIIGNAISLLEKGLRAMFPRTPAGEQAAGLLLVVLILTGSGGIPWLLLRLAFSLHTAAGIGLEAFFCYQMLAVRSLKTESMKVYTALKSGTLDDGRKAVSMIVGRDTQALDETGVVKAAVETVAENFSDGVIAPMFYMALGGPALMFLYKGINTMDSMVGYKNDRYLHFGRAAAKLDDAANFIPARLAAVFLTAAAYFGGFSGKDAWRIFLRDRFNHASPNSAQTESVMAGALQVQLAGNAFYFGKLYEKPTIGDAHRRVEREDIPRANRMMYIGSALAALVFAAAQGMAVYLLA